VRIRRAQRWLGLLVLLGATAGCTGAADASPTAGPAAVASYHPSATAPSFCARLAASGHVPGIPRAVGTLTADPGNPRAVGRLQDAIADLEAVLTDVSDEAGYAELAGELEDLLAALHSATLNPVDDELRGRISDRLAAVGAAVQPVCDFPT
jgi:hypothetical protein